MLWGLSRNRASGGVRPLDSGRLQNPSSEAQNTFNSRLVGVVQDYGLSHLLSSDGGAGGIRTHGPTVSEPLP
jgi:hypothetical protein